MIADFFEPLTAYRAFDVCANGLLVGQAHSEPWPPYTAFLARCGRLSINGGDAHLRDGVFKPAPVFGCDCGIHVLKSASEAEARVAFGDGSYFSSYDRPEGRAWGEVKIWGRIIEHDIGYRAEFAYPSSLLCEDEKLAALISTLYGVPCAHRVLVRPEPAPLSETFVSRWFSPQAFTLNPRSLYYLPTKSVWITSVHDDVAAKPMIVPPAKPSVPQGIVGASRWQQRQYAKSVNDPTIRVADWRTMLRQMVYVQAIA